MSNPKKRGEGEDLTSVKSDRQFCLACIYAQDKTMTSSFYLLIESQTLSEQIFLQLQVKQSKYFLVLF